MAYQKHTHTNPQATYMKAIYIYMYVCIWLRELFKKQHSHFKKNLSKKTYPDTGEDVIQPSL